MSYRAFKHLLGETSLERKCRFLLGTGILLLITGSFWWYARQTEKVAYDQMITPGRLLVPPILAKEHNKNWLFQRLETQLGGVLAASTGGPVQCLPLLFLEPRKPEVEEFQQELEKQWPKALSQYKAGIITPKPRKAEHEPADRYERQLLAEFLEDESKPEDHRLLLTESSFHYYAAIRATESCLQCHHHQGAKKNELLAVVKVRLSTEDIERVVDFNRAVLISTAMVTALLIMSGSYLVVRYVIVKPVKHLKEVSDAISAGELNLRSEIQTGDEFEDLSHAFNRMLRNLVSMQDRLRKVNADLDLKVDELARANLALYESNRLKSDFLATMSHELRTPLNSILGFSEVLLSSNQLGEKQQRWVSNIQTSGERLLGLINDILDLAKIEAGKMEVHPEEFGIADLCEGQLNMFRPLAQKKNIDLRSQIDSEIPLLRQDPVKLQQVLSNLLSNAIKFTPEGGRVIVRAQAEAQQLVLTVIDTGVGIALEDQERVFERFRQAGNPLTREHAGTGLGLSIVRELVKLLGGEVMLRSELGRGSTFTVRLPLKVSEEPRLDFDLAGDRSLSLAQRLDGRLYSARSQESGVRSQESGVTDSHPSSAETDTTKISKQAVSETLPATPDS